MRLYAPTLLFASCLLALSLTPSPAQSPALSSAPRQADRIAPHADFKPRTRLAGHIPAWANAANDAGAVAPSTSIRFSIVLARDPAVEAAFTQFLQDQQNPASPSYHQWLTPQQIGTLYGPTPNDVAALTTWLQTVGITVLDVAPSRVFVEASAPAATVASAFSTSFRNYTLVNPDGTSSLHRSLTAEPSIPNALTPLIQAISGLSETPYHPQSHGKSVPMPASPAPLYSFSSNTVHFVTPGDFVTIFDIQPTYNAGYSGTGQKVAIIDESDIVATDISEFEALTGLPANMPTTVIPTSGSDPGVVSGLQGESTLDIIRVVGTAPNVHMDLVVSSTSTGGIATAASYNVQTLRDPVMTISFGACEANAGLSGVNYWSSLFQQAAAEGISSFVSSGDDGTDACAANNATPPSSGARGINYICSSQYVTCVGGTEFNDTANPALYWSTSNSTYLASALGYIPEGAWNEPSYVSNGVTAYSTSASSGGVSVYVTKPAFQTGTGVPADGYRDVPDVSFPSAGHDGYFACLASGGGNCAIGYFEYFYGTSAAAPSMAAVTALLNQRTGTSQGNLNPLLYRLANSSYAGSANPFHDVTVTSSGVSNCTLSVPSMCNNSNPSPTALTGGVQGYAVTTGYDQVTGWGSLDVQNFVTASAASTPNTSITLSPSASTVPVSQTVTITANVTNGSGSGIPSGTVQFYDNATAIGSPVTLASGTASSGALTLAAGVHPITAAFSSSNTLFNGSSTAAATNVTVVSPATTTTLAASATTISTAQTVTLTASVATASGSPTGTVQFFDNGTALGSPAILSGGSASTGAISLSSGVHPITATYSGDSTYTKSSTASATSITVVVPAISLTATSSTLTFVHGATSGNSDSLTVTSQNLYAGTTQLTCIVTGTTTPAPTCAISPSSLSLTAGSTASASLTVTSVVATTCTGELVQPLSPFNPARTAVALAGLCILLLPIRRRASRLRGTLLGLTLLCTLAFSLTGCSKSSTPASNPCTPVTATAAGTYTITVTAADTTGTPKSTATITTTIQ